VTIPSSRAKSQLCSNYTMSKPLQYHLEAFLWLLVKGHYAEPSEQTFRFLTSGVFKK